MIDLAKYGDDDAALVFLYTLYEHAIPYHKQHFELAPTKLNALHIANTRIGWQQPTWRRIKEKRLATTNLTNNFLGNKQTNQ